MASGSKGIGQYSIGKAVYIEKVGLPHELYYLFLKDGGDIKSGCRYETLKEILKYSNNKKLSKEIHNLLRHWIFYGKGTNNHNSIIVNEILGISEFLINVVKYVVYTLKIFWYSR